MAHTYVNFKQYDINIWGDEHITRVVISSNEKPNEYVSIGDTEHVVNTSDMFIQNYALILMGGKMMDEQQLLHDVKKCYNVGSDRVKIKIDNKYSLCVNSDGDTITYVHIFYGDKGVIKENGSYKRNTNDTFMVRIVNALYGQKTMSVAELTDAVNECYRFNKLWDEQNLHRDI